MRAADEASVYVDALHALGEVLSADAELAGEPESLVVFVEGGWEAVVVLDV